jgi:hypothetical protein
VSVLALLNAYAYVHGHDFTGDTNEVNLDMEATALNKTTFRSDGWTELTGGAKTSTFNMRGFWQSATSDAVDVEAFPDLAVANRTHTMGPAETETGVAYMWQAGRFNYELLGAYNELAPFTLGSQGTDGVGVVKGQLAKEKGTVSATGVLGSGVNLGAGAAGKYLYATLHATSVGTTMTVQVQSDADNTFASPTTVATFSAVTARGGYWLTRVDASSITDTWFRLNVSAITGTFTVSGAIAIQ